MANSRTYQIHSAYEALTVRIFLNVAIGASGAPTITTNSAGVSQCKGVTSITRNSAGNYTIDLKDSFTRLLSAQCTSLAAAPAAAPDMTVLADSSASSPASVQIVLSAAGTPTDPASGEVLLIELCMKNSSI